MTSLLVVIDGTPEGKRRPRTDFRSGRVHEDAEGAKIERAIRAVIAKAYRDAGFNDPATCPVSVTIEAVFAIPPSWPNRYRTALRDGLMIYADCKPDRDNIEKLILDAANGVLWRDDAQVVAGGPPVKRYGHPARTEVRIEFLVNAMPTPAQIAREKVTWDQVVARRAETKKARRAALKTRNAIPAPQQPQPLKRRRMVSPARQDRLI